MNNLCRWFDRYRDGELDSRKRARFEYHLEQCDRCRSGMTFLSNLKTVIEKGSVELTWDFSHQTARRAFEQSKRWDVMVISWLRPAAAWIACAAMLFVFSILALTPSRTGAAEYAEYETLLALNDANGMMPQAYAEEMAHSAENGGVNR
ncbi:MAG TPA: zf-HC2 domain-containing protein [Acidobacteriota bacterium]|jgi:anti-sigma factor RsiW